VFAMRCYKGLIRLGGARRGYDGLGGAENVTQFLLRTSLCLL
jgi:hypothetical protein